MSRRTGECIFQPSKSNNLSVCFCLMCMYFHFSSGPIDTMLTRKNVLDMMLFVMMVIIMLVLL